MLSKYLIEIVLKNLIYNVIIILKLKYDKIYLKF